LRLVEENRGKNNRGSFGSAEMRFAQDDKCGNDKYVGTRVIEG